MEKGVDSIYWHTLSSTEAVKRLKSDVNGLDDEQVFERLKKYGKNEIKRIRRLEPLKILFEQFKSFFVILLIIAAIISGLVSHWIDMYIILIIVIMNAGIGFFQNYKAERSILALRKMLVTKTKVIRSGILKEINTKEVVPGDILIIDEGDKVVADCRIIQTNDLQTNEAVLTGESVPVNKNSSILNRGIEIYGRANMLYKGTSVVRGSARALVVATGMNSEFGKIAGLVQKTRTEKTPLQVKLDSFARNLSFVVIGIAVLIIILGLSFGMDKLQIFLTSISLAVAAVPEGLPAVITICLAFAVQRMYKSNSLIRTLPSAETLGRVTVICTDKTGTITEEKMKVTDLYFDNKVIKTKNLIKGKIKNKALRLLFKINCLCNNARIEKINEKENIIGDPTEEAILKISSDFGFDKKTLTEQNQRIEEFAFTSTRKMMSIIRDSGGSGNSNFISYVKGAPDVVLGKCTREFIGNSDLRLINSRRKELISVYEEMASQGLRVLAFAYKKLDKKKSYIQKDAESDLIFVGFQGMLDAPRKEVKGAIGQAKKAGIKIKMITGDSILTAKAVASQIDINGRAITGSQLDNMGDDELKKQIKDIVVFARTTPEQKLRIINILKEQGEIVAVTGDGINDAPALKRADIGIAMGIRGDDVARETSNIILLDDNFASIIKAVREGRRAYSNIKKFVKFLLATNLGEIAVILFSIIVTMPLPLLPLHILWINLITDSTPALALSNESAEKEIMEQKPKSKEGILHGIWFFILVAGLLAFIATIMTFLIFMPQLDKARTAALTTLVIFEIFFVFTCRSDKPIQKIGFFTNKFLIIAVLGSIALHLIAMYTPINKFLYMIPLGLFDWVKIFGLSISGLVFFEIAKNIRYKINKSNRIK